MTALKAMLVSLVFPWGLWAKKKATFQSLVHHQARSWAQLSSHEAGAMLTGLLLAFGILAFGILIWVVGPPCECSVHSVL